MVCKLLVCAVLATVVAFALALALHVLQEIAALQHYSMSLEAAQWMWAAHFICWLFSCNIPDGLISTS